MYRIPGEKYRKTILARCEGIYLLYGRCYVNEKNKKKKKTKNRIILTFVIASQFCDRENIQFSTNFRSIMVFA